MKKMISSNDLFKIVLVEIENTEESIVKSYYELIEAPDTTIQTFDSYSTAEQVMKQKTEFWAAFIRKIPLYFEVRFIA